MLISTSATNRTLILFDNNTVIKNIYVIKKCKKDANKLKNKLIY